MHFTHWKFDWFSAVAGGIVSTLALRIFYDFYFKERVATFLSSISRYYGLKRIASLSERLNTVAALSADPQFNVSILADNCISALTAILTTLISVVLLGCYLVILVLAHQSSSVASLPFYDKFTFFFSIAMITINTYTLGRSFATFTKAARLASLCVQALSLTRRNSTEGPLKAELEQLATKYSSKAQSS